MKHIQRIINELEPTFGPVALVASSNREETIFSVFYNDNTMDRDVDWDYLKIAAKVFTLVGFDRKVILERRKEEP